MIELSAPAHPVQTALNISGSKSISNRLLILNQVLKTNLHFNNLSDSEDTQLLQQALEQITQNKTQQIDIHHAGTDMRFLTALLSITPGTWILTGSARMKQRPVGPLLSVLRDLGADITCLENENFPPLKINGKAIHGGRVEIDASVSSQFVSALLLIAPAFKNGLELVLKNTVVSKPYIDMTIAHLKAFGIKVTESDNVITVAPFSLFLFTSSIPPDPSSVFPFPSSIDIESDWSSASYWYEICAFNPNAVIELSNFNAHSLQADAILPKLYEALGVDTAFKNNSIVLTSKKRTAQAFAHDFTQCPDLAQTLAVTCAGLGIEAKLTGLQTLKLKETDRIAALKNELEKAGVSVDVTDTSLHIYPRKPGSEPKHLTVATYNDHRMAMSFAPLALVYGTIKIENHTVISKSYPRFWKDLECAGFNVNLQPA